MPKGKEWCEREMDYYELEVVDGTKLHRTKDLHRATDGLSVKIVDGHVIDCPVDIDNLEELPE